MISKNHSLINSVLKSFIRPFLTGIHRLPSTMPNRSLVHQANASQLTPQENEDVYSDNILTTFDNELDRFDREFDKQFSHDFSVFKPPSFGDFGDASFGLTKPANLFKQSELKEDSNNYMVVLNEPGLADGSLKVEYLKDQQLLVFDAHQKKSESAEGYQSSSFASYERSYRLDKPVNSDQIEMKVEGDNIMITVPKTNPDSVVEMNANENGDYINEKDAKRGIEEDGDSQTKL